WAERCAWCRRRPARWPTRSSFPCAPSMSCRLRRNPPPSTWPAVRSWWWMTRRTRAGWLPRCWPIAAPRCRHAPAAARRWASCSKARPGTGRTCWFATSPWAIWKATRSYAASAPWKPSGTRRWETACRPSRCPAIPARRTACARCWRASRSTLPSPWIRASCWPPWQACCGRRSGGLLLPSGAGAGFLTVRCKKCFAAAAGRDGPPVAQRLRSPWDRRTGFSGAGEACRRRAMRNRNQSPERYYADDFDRPRRDSGDERDDAHQYRREHYTRQSGRWGAEEPPYGRRYGERPQEQAGTGRPNRRGPQYEQGGQYPGTRATGPFEGLRSRSADPGQSSYGGFRDEDPRWQRQQ